MVAGVSLSVVAIATFLLMPPFIEAAVADLRFTEPQIGILSSVLAVGTTLAAVTATMWIRRSSWRLVASIALLGLLVATGGTGSPEIRSRNRRRGPSLAFRSIGF